MAKKKIEKKIEPAVEVVPEPVKVTVEENKEFVDPNWGDK